MTHLQDIRPELCRSLEKRQQGNGTSATNDAIDRRSKRLTFFYSWCLPAIETSQTLRTTKSRQADCCPQSSLSRCCGYIVAPARYILHFLKHYSPMPQDLLGKILPVIHLLSGLQTTFHLILFLKISLKHLGILYSVTNNETISNI